MHSDVMVNELCRIIQSSSATVTKSFHCSISYVFHMLIRAAEKETIHFNGSATQGSEILQSHVMVDHHLPTTALDKVPALSPTPRHRRFHRTKYASFTSVSLTMLLGTLAFSVSSPIDQLPSIHHVVMPLETISSQLFPTIDNKDSGSKKKGGWECALQDKDREPPARRLRSGYISAPCEAKGTWPCIPSWPSRNACLGRRSLCRRVARFVVSPRSARSFWIRRVEHLGARTLRSRRACIRDIRSGTWCWGFTIGFQKEGKDEDGLCEIGLMLVLVVVWDCKTAVWLRA